MSFFGVEEMHCAWGNLDESCSPLVINEVTCKQNAVYNNMNHECVCEIGYFEENDHTCQPCFSGCDHCNGPLESDCMAATTNIFQVMDRKSNLNQICLSKIQNVRSPLQLWTANSNNVAFWEINQLDDSLANVKGEVEMLGVEVENGSGFCQSLNQTAVIGTRSLHLVIKRLGIDTEYFKYQGIDDEKRLLQCDKTR